MRTVFIIEDDPVVLHVYKTQLEKAGFHVMTATNGEESFYLLLHKSSPDAILLDLMLPKINGVDVLKTIRAQRKFEKTPIFVFTSNDLSDLAKEALNAGADQIFDKSKIAPADIVDAIRESLSVSLQSLPPLQGEEPTRDIIDKAPETVAGLCKSLQALSKTENPRDRLAQLSHLHKKIQDLAVQATAAGLRAASQMAAALESLLKQLSENLTEINASNLRTISHGIDFLGVLFQQSSSSAMALTAPIKVLVVDDDEISRMAIIRALEKANLDSVSFGNPQDALTMLEDNSFDLIFLDVSMPEISGFEVCLKLRKLPNHKATPVLFVTSLNDFASRSRSRLIGGSDLIAKPFLFTELSVKALTYAFKYRLLDHSVSIDSSLSANEPVHPDFQSGAKTPDKLISPLPSGDNPRPPTQTEDRLIVREHDADSSPSRTPAAIPMSKEAPSQDSSADSMSAPLTAVRGAVIEGVITLDENGMIKALNSVAARFFGYKSTEITGKQISVLIPHVAQGTATNLKKLSVDSAGPPHGVALTGQRKDGSPVTFNFLLKEVTVSGRRLFTGLIREQSARSQPKKSSLKMAQEAVPSNELESLQLEETPDHSKNGRPPETNLPCNAATNNAPVGMAPSAQIPARLDQEAAAREKLEARCAESSKIRTALEQDLARHQKAAQSSQERENELRHRQDELEAQLEKQGLEKTDVQAKLENQLSELKCVEEERAKLSFSRDELARELAERQGNEEQLRKAQVELESQIQDRTRQNDQLASQLQKEVQHREQAVDQAAQLSKTQAAAEEQFAVHKQAEETWRTAQQNTAAEAKRQASQLARVQDQLHKESAERQQAQAQAAELVKAQSALQQELTNYRQTQEHSLATEQDLQSRLAKQTAELVQVRLQLQKEGEQRQQVQHKASSLASTQSALASQLEQHKQTEEALRLKSAELEIQIQDRTRQNHQLASQLQKEVQHREQAVDQAAQLGKTQTAAEEQFALHKRAEETWRTAQQKFAEEAKKQASQLARVQEQLCKESAARQQAEAQTTELVKAQSALQHELTQHNQSQKHSRATEHDLGSRLEKQTEELAQVRLQLQQEWEQRLELQERASNFAANQSGLARQLEQHKRTEAALRLKSVELESQIQDRTRQNDQLASQLQKEVQHRQQAVNQAAQLGKIQAAAEEQFVVHKQAEETRRTAQQKTEAEAKKQATQLTRVQEQLHKESAERQQAQTQAAELVKAQSALQQELTQYHQSQEHWRATEQDFQNRLKQQTGELARVRLQLQKEGEQRQQAQQQASNLASTQTALAGQLEQHKRSEEALRQKSVELENQIQDRTRQNEQLAIQLQKEVHHRQQAVDRVTQLSKIQAAAEEQFVVHKQAEDTWRSAQQKTEAEAKKQATQLTRVQEQLHKESAERQQAQTQAAELVKAQSALQQELTQYHQSQEHWRATEQDFQNRLKQQTGELAQVCLQLQKEGEQRQQAQQQASNLASTQTALAGQLQQHKRSEEALRQKSVELENQIQDRTRQLDQLAIQLQKEVQHRQQAVNQAAQLSKTQAAAAEQLVVHKQAEDTWRSAQQKTEAEVKKQASQLTQAQEQLQKESAERQQAQATAAELFKAQAMAHADVEAQFEKESAERQQLAVLNDEFSKNESVLKEEIGARKLVEEALSRAKESLETRLKEQSRELDSVRLGLKKQATELSQMRQRITEFTNSEIALQQELNQRSQSDAQIEKEQAEMEIRLQTAARESEIARSELQQATHALLRAEAEIEQERYTGLESATAKLRLAEDLCASLRETTSRIAAFSCRLLESNLTKEQHAVVTEMQEMGELVRPRGHLLEFSQGRVELADSENSEICLLKVVELTIEPFATEAKKENIVIGSLVHQDVPALVTGCEGRLRRVLARFIDSSIQITKAGSVIVSVTKESETPSQVVLKFSVRGGDHDLSEDLQRQLIKACSQTGELGPANYTALELGLAAAKKLVEMMVGGVGIDITPAGTCLWCQLTFPKVPGRFPSASRTAEPGDLRVLVIEENEIKRGILQAQITASGMRNAGTNNGVEALSLLRQQISAGDPFDVAIISTGLQDLNGLTLVKIFKGDPVLATTRLVILYDAAEAFSDEPYRKAQVVDFLTKPIRQSELLGLLNRIASESTAKEAAAETGLSRIQSC